MKIKEIKHNHSLTELLKICIFAILMIAPLFASISQMLYVTVNKNAYQSYSAGYVEKYTKVTGANQYVQYNQYQAIYAPNNASASSVTFSVAATDAYKFLPEGETRTINTIAIIAESYPRINIGFSNGETYRVDYWPSTSRTFYFTLNYTSASTGEFRYTNIYLITEHIDSLDNAFYYGVNKMTESSLFNWTQNTAIYTPINTMTTQLGITTPAIAILITYWFILIVIYIVLDIVLKCFTMISHLIFRSS